MSERIQALGIKWLGVIALALIALVAFSFFQMKASVTPDGKVALSDGGLFTAALLSLQMVIGAMRAIWESKERQTLTEQLGGSMPTATEKPAPKDAKEAADRVADAAVEQRDAIVDGATQ